MAIQHQVNALEIGRSYAAAVRDEPAARRLWILAQPDHVQLWLLIERSDMDTERRMYGPSLPLYDLFPDASFRVHVVNPEHYPGLDLEDGRDLEMVLPRDAQEVPPRPQ